MALLKDKIIVIKSLDYSEADKILTVFGKRYGRQTLIAKGLRKITSKNRGNMQTLSMSNISYYEGKGMGLLRESDLVTMLDFGEVDMKAAQRLLVMLNRMLPEGQSEPEIFNKLEALLSGEFSIKRVNKLAFLVLKEAGLLPDTDSCVITGETDDLNYFDPKSLGLVSEKAVQLGKIEISTLLVTKGLDYGSKEICSALDRYIEGVVSA